MTRIGSLCSGYEGIGLGLELALGINLDTDLAWHAEYEAAPSAVLAHHWPQVPNLHDIKLIDWDDIEPVDWLTAGYPCQPFSMAGKRLGEDDERHLWPYIIEGIRRIRPGRVLLENVAGHLSMGFGRVLADLAAVGYVGSWVRLPASGVGAAHQRQRVFILAADAKNAGHERGGAARGRRDGFANGDRIAAYPGDGSLAERPRTARWEAGQWVPIRCQPGGGPVAAADSQGIGRRVGNAENERATGGDGNPPRDPLVSAGAVDWDKYEPAIRRWERLLGRTVPPPMILTKRGARKLSPIFDEWFMGLPAGWITGVPWLTVNEQLHMLGNGVVPQQAAEAVRWLLNREQVAA